MQRHAIFFPVQLIILSRVNILFPSLIIGWTSVVHPLYLFSLDIRAWEEATPPADSSPQARTRKFGLAVDFHPENLRHFIMPLINLTNDVRG